MEEPPPDLCGAGVARRRLHLEVAGDEHPLGARPEADDPPGILLGLHAEERHVVEHPAKQAADEPVAAVGPVGDAPVREDRGHARPPERAEEVGPELRLERDETGRPHLGTVRRTAPGKSSGNVKVAADSGRRARATRSPVAVTVDTTTSAAGHRMRRAWTSGTAAITSPTETACTQSRLRGKDGGGTRTKPRRSRRATG